MSFETRPAGFADAFTAGFAARRGTAFRVRAARRVERRDVLVAVIRVLSIPRRAGFIFYRSENCDKLLLRFTLKGAPPC
jgi:hypothetical protein